MFPFWAIPGVAAMTFWCVSFGEHILTDVCLGAFSLLWMKAGVVSAFMRLPFYRSEIVSFSNLRTAKP